MQNARRGIVACIWLAFLSANIAANEGKLAIEKSKYYRRLLVLYNGTCAPKAQKPVTLP